MRSTTAVLLVVAVVAVAITTVSGQTVGTGTCHTFQSVGYPQEAPDLTRCGADLYKSNSCCTRATAKRAYNWVYEDDGCGIVGATCAQALSDVACAVNCATDLIVTGVNYNSSRLISPGKVVISKTRANSLFSACRGYAWCGTQQLLTSECKTLAATVTAKTRSSSTVSLSIASQPDTCILVADLTPEAFAENILGLAVHINDAVGYVSTITKVPYFSASALGMANPSAVLMMLLVAAISALMML